MAMSMGLVVLFVIVMPTAYAAQHVVGGSSGWTNFGVDYNTWASAQTFTVGDTLLFNYDGSTHNLAQVLEDGYRSCNSSNAIQTYNDRSTTISLTKPGPLYFMCPVAGHCAGGMKLQINVVAPDSSPSPPPETAPSPPSRGTTPSPPPETAPSPPSRAPTTPSPPPEIAPSPPSETATPPAASPPGSNDGATLQSSLFLGFLLVLGTSVALLG